MNEEIDEYDIYHQDFTTVSEWEVFIARIEEIWNEWRLSKSKISKPAVEYTKKWVSKSEDLSFQGLHFKIYFNALDPVKTYENDNEECDTRMLQTELQNGIWDSTTNFLEEDDESYVPFPVSQWYGLKRYVMLCPSVPLLEGSVIKLVMSSLNIAFANVDCAVPVFLRIREHWQQSYLGFYEDYEYKTSFDTIHLKRISNQCLHLSGLESVFKSKISSPVALDTVIVSAKFSYELKDLEPFLWRQRTQSNEFLSIDGFDVKKLMELPFGCEKNPIQSAMLNAIWPKFRESAIVDSSTYSEIDPMMAPTWTITLKMRDNPNCQLTEVINKMMDLLDNNNLLMDTLGLSKSMGIVNPLHKITEAPITISKLVKAAMGQNTNVSEFKGPIPDDLLMPLLYYIFPDAVEDNSFNYPEKLEIEHKTTDELKICQYIKTSPEDGLVWRLSVTALQLLHVGGLPYLAHLWYEFAQELQYRWEHGIAIPGVAEGTPSARSCLLHQKLQLLNCCIARKQPSQHSASSDDEFFDCDEDSGGGGASGGLEQLPWDRPVGRLRRLSDAVMKNGAPLYIPRTQDPPPKTEDQLEEDAELMVRLGDDARASSLRARMMSASLLSDMEAFRAANPGAELCDFVRWYSPRDWLPDGGGALGARMLLPDNPWAAAWAVARPVPAARQRRLFDAAREAEQVLHFLRARTVRGVAELLLPAGLRAAAARAQAAGALPVASAMVTSGPRALEAVAVALAAAELSWARSSAAQRAGCGGGVALGAMERARLVRAAGGSLPAPCRRAFLLRVRTPAGPQLLRASLADDLTIIGAFTERIVCL